MKTKSLLIEPYLLLGKDKNISKTGFEITNFKTYLLTNKFVKVVVDWEAKEEYLPVVRIATLVYDGTSSNGSAFVYLYFGENKIKFGFEVGVKFSMDVDYYYLFAKKTRYGAVIYFALKDWEVIKKEIEINR